MSQAIVLKKGLSIPLAGEAELRVSKTIAPGVVSVCPPDFPGLLPRLLVAEGDAVRCGSPVAADKKHPEILLSAPVSGTVCDIVRGEKRRLLAIRIAVDPAAEGVDFGIRDVSTLDEAQVREALLQSGLWPALVQRPYGILADPQIRPRDIFVSTFSSAPLAPDPLFCFGGELPAVQAGIWALAKLTSGKVHVGLDDNGGVSPFAALQGCELHRFRGPHPAGNVGVQISHVAPIAKGDVVWTVSLPGLVAIGKLFTTGRLDLRRKVAVTGPMSAYPAYAEALPGTPVRAFASFFRESSAGLRIVSGDALGGRDIGEDGCLGWYDNQLTLLREGTAREWFGWINPLRPKLFSADRSYFSWLMPKKKRYALDTNLHGGRRAFLMDNGYYARVLPMDIYPVYLAKACLAGDIEKMERYGIYEVLPEDLATCEFVDPSKNDIQQIIAQGIELMRKEMV